METNIMCWCTTNKGNHGFQNVQSILVPENLYYLECGCIYEIDGTNNIFKRLRPHSQRCAKCGVVVDGKKVLTNGKETWCIECSEGKAGHVENYRHKFVPVFITGYENKWKDMNDEVKRRRDRDRSEPEIGSM